MINNIEDKSAKELQEIVKIQIEEYQKLTKENEIANAHIESLKTQIKAFNILLIESEKSYSKEIELLKVKLEVNSKTKSHWDTAPEGAVKLVRFDLDDYYLNSLGEYWSVIDDVWVKDRSPENNILIDERKL